ncbi:MAG TPA: 16S rRNA (guanine(527)-N(7))-methyltransferase RsmG [Gammaproteobacteria bacterium]|nr:16S rRNA (guanine(527)-N(7))-methyltransferase RsmG [Gammaproteobacteria bacterium]MCH77656.1 16S rRNA (guanine(527)-N(7))-methyltransferase RsmG [Gammaproteobacteria bacterium]
MNATDCAPDSDLPDTWALAHLSDLHLTDPLRPVAADWPLKRRLGRASWRRRRRHRHRLPVLATVVDDLVDLGSGAGFPGLILALVTGRTVDLVESDGRKCAFLREAARLTAAPVRIHETRIAAAPVRNADLVTARALAPLDRLCAYGAPILARGGICLFLKGRRVAEELTEAEKRWKMHLTRIPSRSDPDGVILRVGDLCPV